MSELCYSYSLVHILWDIMASLRFEYAQIQQRYKGATGYMPFLFEGSSPGAGKFGYLRIRRRHPPNFN